MTKLRSLDSLSNTLHGKLNKYKVLVAHPGTQHSYQTAIALQDTGMLQNYVTGFYYKTTGVLDRLIRFLSLKCFRRLERQLSRRRADDLDQDLIRTFSFLELIYILTTRLKATQKWSGQAIRWRNRRFDEKIAVMVKASRPDAVICYNSCALNTFKMCKKTGSVAILDQSIGHIRSGIEILREEAELHPEFAESLSINDSERLVEQCTSEALAADKVLAASEYVRSTLVANGVSPSRIVILPYGVDVARFHPAAKRDDESFRVLFVGGISQRKGIKYLLEAFKQLALPRAELTLVGGVSGDRAALSPYRGIYRHVPHVPHRKVHTLFQNADIFVFPSLYEGSALVIYEALASGLPVITTPNSGSVVRDGIDGFIVPIRDIEALKEKMLLLYQDKDLRNRMSLQARIRAESFTWLAYRQKLGALVENFIRESRL